jgi:hypothetical protein
VAGEERAVIEEDHVRVVRADQVGGEIAAGDAAEGALGGGHALGLTL